MKGKKKAYGYLRVSGKGQLDGGGLDRQKAVIEGYARKAGYDVVSFFREEGVSGTTDEADRPAFQEMIALILRNGVETVIVEAMDRLAREYRIQETLLIYMVSKGITLISASTEEDITAAVESDPMRRAMVQIQGVFGELEKSLLVKKLRTGRERVKKQRGKCEGAKSYKEVDPDLIREIKRLRRPPKGVTKKRSFREIAEILNSQGRVTRRGRPFKASNVANIAARS